MSNGSFRCLGKMNEGLVEIGCPALEERFAEVVGNKYRAELEESQRGGGIEGNLTGWFEDSDTDEGRSMVYHSS